MATIAAQVNSAPTMTADALTRSASNTLALVATQEGGAQYSNETASASGIWLMTWTNEEGDTRHATLHIQQEGEALSGPANVQAIGLCSALKSTGIMLPSREASTASR